MTRLTVALLLAIAAAGCDETTGPSDPRQFDRRAFVDARSRWRAAGLSDYTAEIRHSCFCPAHLNFWTRVTVRNDKVASADPVSPLPAGISPQLSGWRTVSQLFDAIESAASDEGDAVVRIAAQYDPDLGYPREVSITCRQTIADCDRAFYLRGLTR